MNTTFKKFAHGEYSHSAEFQEEGKVLKESISTARKILDVRSRDALMDFVKGPLMESMRGELMKAFPVPEQSLERFTSNVTSILLDVRDAAEESFHDVSKKALCRPSKSLAARDWDGLKSDLRHTLKEIAPHIVELHAAAHDTPIQPSALRHNI